MIKNLLYSLFLHFIILAVIYSDFSSKEIPLDETNEFAVSVLSFQGDLNSNEINFSKNNSKKDKPNKKNKKNPKKDKSKPENKGDLNKEIEDKKLEKPKLPESSEITPKDEKGEVKEQLEKKEKQEEIKKENENIEDNNSDKKEEVKDLPSDQGSDDEELSNLDQKSSINDIEGMDLSAREKFNIQSQLNSCYKRAIDESKLTSGIKLTIRVAISEDGYIESELDEEVGLSNYNNPSSPSFKIAVDNIRRAIDLCSPLRNLPIEKYDIWKEAMLEFDEEKIK